MRICHFTLSYSVRRTTYGIDQFRNALNRADPDIVISHNSLRKKHY